MTTRRKTTAPEQAELAPAPEPIEALAQAPQQTKPAEPVVTDGAMARVSLTDGAGFALAQRVARALCSSTLVPQRYQGAGNLPNCIIALNMAARLRADPLMVMQNLYVVHGSPAWSAQFMIATFNTCGRFSAIRYTFTGEPKSDDWGCRAWALELATGDRLEGAEVTIALAKAEGWHGKNGSKWQTMPEQMLRYRAASWFVRAYAPEIAMGLQTVEEIADTYDATPIDVTAEPMERPPMPTPPELMTADGTPYATLDADERVQFWIDRIGQSASVAELRIISAAVSKAGLADDELEDVTTAWSERREAIAAGGDA